MPYKFEKTPINNPEHDKRVKLTDEQRENIRAEYALGNISTRGLERKYGVSRRLIQFILSPEKQEKAKKDFAERQKDGRYYSKEKQREYIKKHRRHKKELVEKGLLKIDDTK
ncbi:hypothetical protein AAXB25_14895 [Paenibacillus lautus]|uniref:hypothetical protein n=1 Tax=Paenibacillus lautus TaxID=1401 RepID=UPI003D26D921